MSDGFPQGMSQAGPGRGDSCVGGTVLVCCPCTSQEIMHLSG